MLFKKYILNSDLYKNNSLSLKFESSLVRSLFYNAFGIRTLWRRIFQRLIYNDPETLEISRSSPNLGAIPE
jgi:hypothetical protein